MKTTLSPAANSAAAISEKEERIKHLPAEAREAFQRFQKSGDPAVLDPVIFAILADFIPTEPARPLAELPANTQLIGELGFDSLSITEVVFFSEDLFGITISNDEIVQVRTLGDLRTFIQRKVTRRAAD